MAGLTQGRAAGIRDLFVASDPGLGRFRTAASAGLAMAGALALEYLFARLTHADAQSTMVSMIIGTVVAMLGSNALDGPEVLPKIRTAVFFPVAIGLGLAAGMAVSDRPDLMLVGFVLVMFAAVFVRRFGLPFFFYGFMGWMGYFFASFLHPPMSRLPSLLLAVTLSTAWVLLISTTVLHTRSGTTLRHVRRSFGARARSVARAAADLLAAGEPRRARLRHRLHVRQLRLVEAALIVEGWSARSGALPEGWSATALRRRLLESQLAIESLAQAADALAGPEGEGAGPDAVRRSAHRVADLLARHQYERAARAARALLDAVPDATPGAALPAARQLAAAAAEYVELARRAQQPPRVGDTGPEFEPAVGLVLGALPGSASVAKEVDARGRRWNPVRRLTLSTRQAFQAALAGGIAIVVGKEISEQRYYWAVIAAFIAFTGTATRSETFIKATHRVTGTLLGLVAGIGLAHLTAGHTVTALTVIVLSMSCGFYLVKVSYAFMIFFVTIMVSQMYTVLHEFSPALLVLRLEETAAGALVGILVSLLFLPTSTRDTVNDARGHLFSALADLLDEVAHRLTPALARGGDDSGRPDPDALSRAVDNRLRAMALVAAPLTRPLVWGNDPRLVRHRLTLYAAAARRGRVLAALVREARTPDGARGVLGDEAAATAAAAACRALAAACRDLAAHPGRSLVPTAEVTLRLGQARAALAEADGAGVLGRSAALLPAVRLTALLGELATAPPLRRGGPAAPVRTERSGSPVPPAPVTAPTASVTASLTVARGGPRTPNGVPAAPLPAAPAAAPGTQGHLPEPPVSSGTAQG
ncbi:FUSC family protein [Streptomyces sp. NPDC007088]|uniref:FUSC family protein n=1 Tax=Streptomyces sp. NPDC007088 TaxID=3364773 RepID=UPI00369D1018